MRFVVVIVVSARANPPEGDAQLAGQCNSTKKIDLRPIA